MNIAQCMILANITEIYELLAAFAQAESPEPAETKAGPEKCGNEWTMKYGYFCQLPKGHSGDHESECPNPAFHQSWSAEPAAPVSPEPPRCPQCGSERQDRLRFDCFRGFADPNPWHREAQPVSAVAEPPQELLDLARTVWEYCRYNDDLRHVTKLIGNAGAQSLPAQTVNHEMLAALREFIADAYIDGSLCGWCGYRPDKGESSRHNAVCRVARAESAIARAESELKKEQV